MKFKSFKFNGVVVDKKSKISKILEELQMFWLIESEFENADVEIKNNTLIWNNGDWHWGNWQYGIWLNGTWHDGIWESGIWESGTFKNGKFLSGIWKSGDIHGGDANINITNNKNKL